MLERGEVVALEGGQARVRFRRSSACGNCQACGMLKDMSEIEIKLDNILHAEAGDLVTVEMSSRNLLKSSAIAYVFPLIFLIIGLILGIIGRRNNRTDGMALAGIITSAIGLAIFVLILVLAISLIGTAANSFSSFYDFMSVSARMF